MGAIEIKGKKYETGSLIPVVETLPFAIDPVEFFSKLSDFGRKNNSLLFESASIVPKYGERSLGTSDPCLKITGKDESFEIIALNDTGKMFVGFLKNDFGFCDEVHYDNDRITGKLKPKRNSVSEEERLKLKNHSDILRAIAFKFRPVSRPFIPYCGLFGAVSYDFIDQFEDLPVNKVDLLNDADYIFYFVDNLFMVDHKMEKTYFVANVLVTGDYEKTYSECASKIENYRKLADEVANNYRKNNTDGNNNGKYNKNNSIIGNKNNSNFNENNDEKYNETNSIVGNKNSFRNENVNDEPRFNANNSIVGNENKSSDENSNNKFPFNEKGVNAGFDSDLTKEEFIDNIKKIKNHIIAGDVYQCVISRTISTGFDGNAFDIYSKLRKSNPGPYMFYINNSGGVVLGSSPEMNLRVEGNGGKIVEIRPIAGTKPRGYVNGKIDHDLDSRYEIELKTDPKEIAEHTMLVDLARNDIARISKPGTRYVDEPYTIEKYSHVQHLVSNVRGVLKDDLDALHAYLATMNMGTLTGAPKVEAMKLIRLYEKTKRGFYGGAVGYLTPSGDMDSAILIRSVRVKNGKAYVRVGAGIVYDSDPESEYVETEKKAMACLNAIGESK